MRGRKRLVELEEAGDDIEVDPRRIRPGPV
jgi:hypothetical protein